MTILNFKGLGCYQFHLYSPAVIKTVLSDISCFIKRCHS